MEEFKWKFYEAFISLIALGCHILIKNWYLIQICPLYAAYLFCKLIHLHDESKSGILSLCQMAIFDIIFWKQFVVNPINFKNRVSFSLIKYYLNLKDYHLK